MRYRGPRLAYQFFDDGEHVFYDVVNDKLFLIRHYLWCDQLHYTQKRRTYITNNVMYLGPL